MSKYFIKYLPVEGEIKEGDIVMHPHHGLLRLVKYSSKFLCWDCEIPYLNNEDLSFPAVDKVQKVKLFLCSRDIKIGDKVKIDVMLNGVYNDYEFVKEDTEDGVKCQTFDGVGMYFHYPEHEEEENIFKVIGEISSDTTWVKEGDEFDENEVELWEKLKNHKWTLEDVKKYEGLMGKIINPEKYFNIKIKCPTCSHFH